MGSDCIFCAIITGDAPAAVIHEDEHTLAFLDIAPLARGHTLVVPREHCVDLFDIGPDRAVAVMRSAIAVAGMLRDAFQAPGMNLLQASGALAGQTVFHFHVHVLPRYGGTEIKVSFPNRSIAARSELTTIADAVRRVRA